LTNSKQESEDTIPAVFELSVSMGPVRASHAAVLAIYLIFLHEGKVMNRVVSATVLAIAAFILCGDVQAQTKPRGYKKPSGSSFGGQFPVKPSGAFPGSWPTQEDINPTTPPIGNPTMPPIGDFGGGGMPSAYEGILSSFIRGLVGGKGGMPGKIQNDFDSVIRELQNQNQDHDSPFGASNTFEEKPTKPTRPAKLPKPTNSRAASFEESLKTKAVDGKIVENPFVKSPPSKDGDQ
jgi:hypothetical protein